MPWLSFLKVLKIMIETNIWLDKEDKQVLTKKAQQKQLSLSTFIDIIVKHYYIICHANIYQNYIHKGKYQTHIKLRNQDKNPLTPTTITNCLYCYLHKEQVTKKFDGKIQTTKFDRKIQSDSDKTIDKFYLGNQIIRTEYMIKKYKRT